FANTLFAQISTRDIVYLKSGNIIRGEITEIIINQDIKIKTLDGSLFVFEIKDIEKIIKEEVGQVQKKPFLPNQETIQTNATEYRIPQISTLGSFILPGIGQFYNGQPKKGSMYFVWNIASYGIMYFALNEITYKDSYSNSILFNTNFWSSVAVLSCISGISSWVCSMVDANRSATKINKQLGLVSIKLGDKSQLSISPDVKLVNNYSLINSTSISPSYGLNMRISF
ncbi:MAG: hypothetical protein WCR29_05830, partial [Bacteroidales bacterium]